MRICLDVRHQTVSGASTFMTHLVDAMLRADHGHQLVLLELEGAGLLEHWDCERLICPAVSPLRQYLWVQRELPAILRRSGIDVYHSLKHLGPFKAQYKLVFSLSTLGGFSGFFSGLYPMSLSEWVYWGYGARRWLKRLDWLITSTSFIGERIGSRFNFPADRITTVAYGRDLDFCPPEHESGGRARTGRPYLLHVGNIVPVKNTMTLVAAFARLSHRYPELDLVICGSQAHRYSRKTAALAESLGVSHRVKFRGFLEKRDLIDLYRYADVLVLPSLHEGFGLALLEGMACGTPCIISDRPALPEVGGDAVFQYGPAEDPGALAEAIDRVLGDEALRKDLSARGVQRAALYSWDRAARETLAVYDRLA